MPRILTCTIALYWTVHFGLLAAAGLGLSAAELPLAGPATGLGFGLASSLFLWLLLNALFDRRMSAGDTEDVARLAVAISTGMLVLLLVSAAVQAASVSAAAASLQVGALLVSYLAIDAERRLVVAAEPDATETGAAEMALSAAHNALLIRISGRSGPRGSL